ncbi:unnamed protein product [Closterium sp. NIES-64]|nr:unnamed protein product [Closterium sp. NIES-64]
MQPSKAPGSPSNFTPATPLVAHSRQVHERGQDGAGVLPGMIPTPFLATYEDTPASARGEDTVLGGDGGGDDVARRAMDQIRLLWAQVQASRGTKSTLAAAHGGGPNITIGEDLHAALAAMDGAAANESGKGGGVVMPAAEPQPQARRPNSRFGDAPQQSEVRRDACVATQARTRPACAAEELAPVAEAFARPHRGFAMNRLSGAGRLAIVGNHVAPRVGGVGVGTETGMAAGSVAPGMQGRGLKRERPKMTIVVDYNPNDARPELQPGMPPADKIHFYAKKAMHLLLRSCAAHGVTHWPTDKERNVALLVVLRCHYDVCQLDVDRAMNDGAYSKVVNKIWSKFRSDSSSNGRRRIVDGLEIKVAATGIYKLEIDINTKKDLHRKYAPSACRGSKGGSRWRAHRAGPMYAGPALTTYLPAAMCTEKELMQLVSTWSCERGDLQPFTTKVFFQACKAAYPEWVFGGNLVLVPYHIAWVLYSVLEVITHWLGVSKGRWYDLVVGGFRWGAEHLYVNESDLEEFKPVQYGGKMDPSGDTDEPWLA